MKTVRAKAGGRWAPDPSRPGTESRSKSLWLGGSRDGKDRLMRAVSLAAIIGIMILAAGLAPARAMPASSPITTAILSAAPPNLLPAKHHGRHWRWRHRHGGWSRLAPAPE